MSLIQPYPLDSASAPGTGQDLKGWCILSHSPSQNTHSSDFPFDWSSRTESRASTTCSADVICLRPRSAAFDPLQLASLHCYGITATSRSSSWDSCSTSRSDISPEEGSSTRPLDIGPLMSPGKSTPAWHFLHLPPQPAQVSWST